MRIEKDWVHQIENLADKPFFVFRPQALERAVRFFISGFPGQVMFAVKTNPEPFVLSQMWQLGVRDFDVASIGEIELVHALLPQASLFYMHPVKSPEAIRLAYYKYGVRHFAFDSAEELHKIMAATDSAKDLSLHLRLAIPNTYSEHSLSDKFGIDCQHAPALLQLAKCHAQQLGVSFHVGSQCMHPDAYSIAMNMASKVLDQSAVRVDYFNVGGGFPSIYPGMHPPPLLDYFDVITQRFDNILKKHPQLKLLSEPGRTLVAEASSLVVRVELRKEQCLYINDGTYGCLFDAGSIGFIYPTALVRVGSDPVSQDSMPFSFYGPTCDALDFMKGPFYLPSDVRTGDYIEIGQMGAYGNSLATNFNGFGVERKTVVSTTPPLLSMFADKAPELTLVKQPVAA